MKDKMESGMVEFLEMDGLQPQDYFLFFLCTNPSLVLLVNLTGFFVTFEYFLWNL